MFALLFALLTINPVPADFSFDVETNTEVVIVVSGVKIKPDTVYNTPPLFGPATVSGELRWLDGDTVRVKTFCLPLKPGHETKFKVKILTQPMVVVAA